MEISKIIEVAKDFSHERVEHAAHGLANLEAAVYNMTVDVYDQALKAQDVQYNTEATVYQIHPGANQLEVVEPQANDLPLNPNIQENAPIPDNTQLAEIIPINAATTQFPMPELHAEEQQRRVINSREDLDRFYETHNNPDYEERIPA